MIVLEILAGVLILIAGLLFFLTVLGVSRAPDGLTQANLLGNMTGIALPLIIIAKLLYDTAHGGVGAGEIIRALVAILCLWFVLAIASYVLGRSLYHVGVEQQQDQV